MGGTHKASWSHWALENRRSSVTSRQARAPLASLRPLPLSAHAFEPRPEATGSATGPPHWPKGKAPCNAGAPWWRNGSAPSRRMRRGAASQKFGSGFSGNSRSRREKSVQTKKIRWIGRPARSPDFCRHLPRCQVLLKCARIPQQAHPGPDPSEISALHNWF